MTDPDLSPIHPGEILREDFLKPMALSQSRLARALHVPPRRINEIVLGKRAVTADTALRLSRFFGTTARFWMNLQADYDLRTARRHTYEASELRNRISVHVVYDPEDGLLEPKTTDALVLMARMAVEASKRNELHSDMEQI